MTLRVMPLMMFLAVHVGCDSAALAPMSLPSDAALITDVMGSDQVSPTDLPPSADVPPIDIPTTRGIQTSCSTPGTPGCGLLEIAGGTFTMGEPMTPEGAIGASPEQPGITVGPFLIDQYEVTVARFRSFWNGGAPRTPSSAVQYPNATSMPWEGMVNTESELREYGHCNWGMTGRDDHPINCVNWATAQAFCVWDGGRLPTEAEWEFAARGPMGRIYPWGDSPPPTRTCWNRFTPERLGTCPASASGDGDSPFGVRNMGDNVEEWVADWAVLYTAQSCWGQMPRTNPLCADRTTRYRIRRGGSWYAGDIRYLRAATRGSDSTTDHSQSTGFRCARTRVP